MDGTSHSTPVFNICSLNCRGLGKDSKLLLLDQQLSKIRYDLVALQETKKKGQTTLTLNSGATLYSFSDNSSHGVGFVVSPACHTRNFKAVSSRVASLDLPVGQSTIRAISCYAPTTAASDDDYKKFLSDVTSVLRSCDRRTIPLLLGDFNAKLGIDENKDTYVGPYGTGQRNDRGRLLLEYLQSEHLRCWSSFFRKKISRRWTWLSPNGLVRNEIDYAIGPVNSALSFMDIGVLASFDYDSDHRLLRTTVRLRTERRRRPTCRPRGERYVSRALFNYGVETSRSNNDGTSASIYNDVLQRLVTAYDTATCIRKPAPFISERTLTLLRRRRTLQNDPTPQGHIEFTIASKAARASRKEDVRLRRQKRLRRALEYGTSLQAAVAEGKPTNGRITELRDDQGQLQHSNKAISTIAKKFYEKLYDDTPEVPLLYQFDDPAPPFLEAEILNAIRYTAPSTSPGPDRLAPEALKWASPAVSRELTTLFNQCLRSGQLPSDLLLSRTKLLFKKGEAADIANYRPITLLNAIYKVLSRCILRRLERLLEDELSTCQTGFRRSYGTSDNIHSLRQLIEKTKEFRMPLFLCFVDIQKAFDRVQHSALWASLLSIGFHPQLTGLLKIIYETSSAALDINGEAVPYEIHRGVRQGDVLSPQLFSLVLDTALRKLDWTTTGIRVDGTFFSHLLYADDAVLAAPNKRTLVRMVKEFSSACRSVGLNINAKKTDYMNNQNDSTPLRLLGAELLPRPQVIYLGISLSMPLDWDKEVSRRISSGWAAYNSYREFMKTPSMPMYHKRKLFNACILPRLIYGSESWALSTNQKDRLRVTQRKMERSMLNCRLQDRLPNAVMRRITRLKDACREAAKQKFNFCSRLVNQSPDRWSVKLTSWFPYNRKRCPGRPSIRWKDELVDATSALSRSRNRGRVRLPQLRGQQFLRASTDVNAWKTARDHHIAKYDVE